MVKLERYQGFSADLAGAICLLYSSLMGVPVSTTHTKTSAIMGVGAVKRVSAINFGVVKDMMLTWIFTFPGCGLISFVWQNIYVHIWITGGIPMSKKQDDYYFDNFMKCAEYSCKAAYLLKEILTEFQPEEISKKMEEIHEIERQADTQRHEITDKLAKAFITPIEREDIIALSHHIDDVTDKIEEVLIRVYINNVQEMCQEVFLMLDVVIECCEELQTLLKEFKNFKHSKELKPSIIRMNTLEEKRR